MTQTAAELLAICRDKGLGFFEAMMSLSPDLYFPFREPEQDFGVNNRSIYEAASGTVITTDSSSKEVVWGTTTAGAARDPSKGVRSVQGLIRKDSTTYPFTTASTAATLVFALRREDENDNDYYGGLGTSGLEATLRTSDAVIAGETTKALMELAVGPDGYTRWKVPVASNSPELFIVQVPAGTGARNITLHINGVEQPVDFSTYNGAGLRALPGGIRIGKRHSGAQEETTATYSNFAMFRRELTSKEVTLLSNVWNGTQNFLLSQGGTPITLTRGVYGSVAGPALFASATSRPITIVASGDSTLIHQGGGWVRGWHKFIDDYFGFVSSHLNLPTKSGTTVNNPYFGTTFSGNTDWTTIVASSGTPADSAVKRLLETGQGFSTSHGPAFLGNADTYSKNSVFGVTANTQITERMIYRVDHAGISGNLGEFETGARRNTTPYSGASIASGSSTVTTGTSLAEHTMEINADAGRSSWTGMEIGNNPSNALAAWSGDLYKGSEIVDFADRTAGGSFTPWIYKGGQNIDSQYDSSLSTARPFAVGRAMAKLRQLHIDRSFDPKVLVFLFSGFNESSSAGFDDGVFFEALQEKISWWEMIWEHNGWDKNELSFVVFPSSYAYDYDDPETTGDAFGNATTRARLIDYETQAKELAAARTNVTVVATREVVPAASWSASDRYLTTDSTHYSDSGYERVVGLLGEAMQEAANGNGGLNKYWLLNLTGSL